jgi:hydrogenase maturation protease
MHSARLVIGYGNPLRADDGFGWIVAQQLRRDLPGDRLPADVVVLAEHQLTPELAEPISRASFVIFVDAREGNRPGRVDCHTVVPAEECSPAFSHDVDPPSLLQMARLLFGSSPTAVVITVDGEAFGYGTDLSPVVQASLPEVIRYVLDILVDGVAALSAPAAIGTGHRSIGG